MNTIRLAEASSPVRARHLNISLSALIVVDRTIGRYKQKSEDVEAGSRFDGKKGTMQAERYRCDPCVKYHDVNANSIAMFQREVLE